jgi:predicted XRE-type DNA-binding protein
MGICILAGDSLQGVSGPFLDPHLAAENLRVRSHLVQSISRVVRGWGVTQQEAAGRLAITQPRLNDLLRSKIDKFSLDALVNRLSGAGLDIRINIIEKTAA